MKKTLLSCLCFLMATFMNAQIDLGVGSTTNGIAPISSYYGYSYVQQIFPKSEINADAAGNITGLKFYLSPNADLTNSSDWIVYIGHTTKSDFASNTDWVALTDLTQVYSGAVTNNAGVVEITFTTPFAYNNVDNLVIAAEENASDYDGFSEAFYVYNTSANRSLFYRSDTTNPDPASPPTTGGSSNLGRNNYNSAVTILGLTPSAIPACPTVSEPSPAATGISLTPTFTWGTIGNATGYRLSVGSTPGGTDVLNNQDLGNVTTYTLASTLQYNTSYYYTLSSYNAGASSVGCSEQTFTTLNIPCPTVSSPAAGATGVSTTPTITWGAVTDATGYKLSVGTTAGGTDILNNQDLGNTTSYTFGTALTNGTVYYYTVNSYDAVNTSSSCTEMSFTTICNSVATFSENFDTVTAGQWPLCWGKVGSAGSAYTQTSSAISSPNNLYIYASSTASLPVVSMPPLNTLQSGLYRLKFKARANFTVGGNIEVGYLTDPTDAATFVSLSTFTTTSTSTPDDFVLNGITAPAGVTTLAFRHTGDPSNSVLIDDVVYELLPSCVAPSVPTATMITTNSALISWTAPATAPANGYDIYYSTNSTAPTAATTPVETGVPGLTHNMGSLAPATTYYVWVRSRCSASDQSEWSSSVSFTTECAAVIPDYTNDFSSFPGNCWSQASDGSPSTGPSGTDEYWYEDGFLNSGFDGAAKMNIYTSSFSLASRIGWLKTNAFDLSAGNYRVKFDFGVTEYADTTPSAMGSDDVVEFVVSTDGGNTWTVLQTWNAANAPSNTSTVYSLDLTGYTSPNTIFAFYGSNGTVADDEDYEFFVDNFVVETATLATSEVSGNKNSIKAYPNPFSDVLNISDSTNVRSVLITDIAGRLIKTISNPGSVLHLNELNSGMYLVILELKDGSKQTIKTIKK